MYLFSLSNSNKQKLLTNYGDFEVSIYKRDHEPMPKIKLREYISNGPPGYIMDEELASFIMSNQSFYETPIYWKDNYFSLLPSNIKSHHQCKKIANEKSNAIGFLFGHAKTGSPLHIGTCSIFSAINFFRT